MRTLTPLSAFILATMVVSMLVCALIAVNVIGDYMGVPMSRPASSEPTSWIDPVTKCEFLIAPTGGMTPRLNTFGQPICADTLGVDYE